MSDRAPPGTNGDLLTAEVPFVYRFALRLTGSRLEGEDLAQQALLQAYAHREQLRDVERVRPWLATIVRHAFLRLRKQTPRPVLLTPECEPMVEPPPPELIDSEELQRALDELPEEFRTPVILFYFQSLSYKEIATTLEIPLGTVMSRLARAKAHLRTRLAEPEPTTTSTSRKVVP